MKQTNIKSHLEIGDIILVSATCSMNELFKISKKMLRSKEIKEYLDLRKKQKLERGCVGVG